MYSSFIIITIIDVMYLFQILQLILEWHRANFQDNSEFFLFRRIQGYFLRAVVRSIKILREFEI